MTVLFFCFCLFFPDAPTTEQQELFTQKLQQCCTLFDFIDSVADLKSKEVKRATLNELVDYVSTNRGVLVEAAYPEIINMVRISFKAHLCIISLSKPFGKKSRQNKKWRLQDSKRASLCVNNFLCVSARLKTCLMSTACEEHVRSFTFHTASVWSSESHTVKFPLI